MYAAKNYFTFAKIFVLRLLNTVGKQTEFLRSLSLISSVWLNDGKFTEKYGVHKKNHYLI